MKDTKKRTMREKAEALNELIDQTVAGHIDIPDGAVIRDAQKILDVATQKRIEIVKCIDKHKPSSINEIAKITGRTKQAVVRDIKYLEDNGIIKLHKKGKTKIPTVENRYLIMDLCA